MRAVPDEQDGLLRRFDELHGLGDHLRARALLHEAIGLGRDRRRHVEIFENHVLRVLDVHRPRRTRLRDAQRLANDLIRLVRVFDARAVLHRGLDQSRLLDELNAAATHPLFRDARTLTAEENDR